MKIARALALPLAISAFVQAASAAPPAEPALVGPLPSLAPLVDAVKGAVVNVDVKSKVRGMEAEGMAPFGFQNRRGPQIRQGTGSGFIIESDGHILTNNHVVQGADRVTVRLEDGRSFDAQVVGRDPLTDVALLKIKGKVENLPVVHLGDSDAMHVGDWVVAIGNPFGLASSVSAGILLSLIHI